MPFVGPANSVAEGGIPLKDVFSQYGQGYLLLDLFYLFLPRTLSTASLANFIINNCQFLLYLIMLRKLVKSNIIFTAIGILSIGLWHFLPGHPHNHTPSHGGLRYLATYLLATSLILLPENRKYSIFSIISLAVSIFWSFEAFIYALGIYTVFLITQTYLDNKAPYLTRLIQSTTKFIAIFAGICLLEIIIYRISYGQMPRIDLYISLIMPYLSNNMRGNHSSFFEVSYYTFDKGFFYWIILVITYTATIGICLYSRIQDKITPITNTVKIQYLQFTLLAIFGIAISMTCILNTNKVNLVITSFPFFLMLALLTDTITQHHTNFAYSRKALLLPLAILCTVCCSFLLRQNKPYERLIDRLLQENSNISLKRLDTFCDPVNNACKPEKNSGGLCTTNPDNIYCNPNQDFTEAELLVQKWQSQEKEILLLHPWSSIISVKLAKRNVYPTSWPIVELLSSKLISYITETGGSKLHVGKNIIVHNAYVHTAHELAMEEIKYDYNAFNILLMQQIEKNWNMVVIDKTPTFTIFELTTPKF
jgi:hypothetical protein